MFVKHDYIQNKDTKIYRTKLKLTTSDFITLSV